MIHRRRPPDHEFLLLERKYLKFEFYVDFIQVWTLQWHKEVKVDWHQSNALLPYYGSLFSQLTTQPSIQTNDLIIHSFIAPYPTNICCPVFKSRHYRPLFTTRPSVLDLKLKVKEGDPASWSLRVIWSHNLTNRLCHGLLQPTWEDYRGWKKVTSKNK